MDFFSKNVAFYDIIKSAIDRQTVDILAVWDMQLAICMPEN
jgi:hypothetical protein